LIDCDDPDCGGKTCEDGDRCTTGEKCAGASCEGGARKACATPPGVCFLGSGTCDSQSGDCIYGPKPSGAQCDTTATCLSGRSCDGAGTCDGGAAIKCNTPPGPCFDPVGTCRVSDGQCVYTPKVAGTDCDDGNACTSGTKCDAAGKCAGGTTKACTSSPGQCYVDTGVCNVLNGTCLYKPKGSGTACTSSNACVKGETCNGSGACTGGTSCPNTNPCVTLSCSGGRCVLTERADGVKCGGAASSRCCNGSCVDISNNPSHCGGCDTRCAGGRACESVSATSSCSPSPGSTSGRCRCAGATAECPRGQICRAGQSSYNDRCTPSSGANCSGGEQFVDVNFCPNYCRYP
jgi:hypothetical protein